jgi:hypothetical protein
MMPKNFRIRSHALQPTGLPGIAWHPGRSAWVLWGSFGLFYDRYPFAFLNDAIQLDGIHGCEQYAVGATAAQAFALAQGGTLNAPLDGALILFTSGSSFPFDLRPPRNGGGRAKLGS